MSGIKSSPSSPVRALVEVWEDIGGSPRTGTAGLLLAALFSTFGACERRGYAMRRLLTGVQDLIAGILYLDVLHMLTSFMCVSVAPLKASTHSGI